MTVFGHTIKKRYFIFGALLLLVLWVLLTLIVHTPSNDRTWSKDQELLPYAEFVGDEIHVKNIRNFEYLSRDEYVANYYDKTIVLDDIVSVDYIVEPLASVAAAHTLLSFGLRDGSHIAVSVEIRKEIGEEFSPLWGMLEEYEIMYVIADERDALGLRALHRENPVYVYPTVADASAAQQLFVDVLDRANALIENPEFYNTLTNSCATNIADHINNIVPGRIGWDYRLLLPMDSDVLAYELGLIDNGVSLEKLRETYHINEQIAEHIDSPNFSAAIRADRTTNDLDQ